MNKIASNKFIKYSFFTLSLVWIAVLILDIYLSMHGKSVCPTSECKIAESYVIGGGYIFQIIGLLFYIGLSFLFFIYLKKKLKLFENIIWLVILSAISFDGVLIGYLFKMETFCILCTVFAVSLFIVLILICLYLDKKFFVLLGIGLWISSFSAINALKLDITTIKPPDIGSSVIINAKPKDKPEYHADLFVSLHCIHCIDVLYNLAKQKTFEKIEWNLYFLGSSKSDMLRIAHMLKDPNLKNDPFGTILKFALTKEIKDIEIPKEIKKKLDESNKYFIYKGFRGIPLLIVKTNWYETIVAGDKQIGKFLLEKGIVNKWYLIRAK